MRYLALFFLFLLQISCTQNKRDFTQIIVENKIVNPTFLDSINAPEKALLSWVLFAYGNECTADSNKPKCQLLKLLKIDNECDTTHVTFLNKWLDKNVLMQYKLRKCPNLPAKFAVQNTIEKIVLSRVSDTLRITVKVRGMNTAQEKFWNIERTESFILKRNTLIAVNK